MAGWNRAIALEFSLDCEVSGEEFSQDFFHTIRNVMYVKENNLKFVKSPLEQNEEGKLEFDIQLDHKKCSSNLSLMLLCFISMTGDKCQNALIVGDTTDSDEFLQQKRTEIIENLKHVQNKAIKRAVYSQNFELEDTEELLTSVDIETIIT